MSVPTKGPGGGHERSLRLVETIWSLNSIALLVLGLRLFTSIRIFRKLFLADILMIIAASFGLIADICVSIGVTQGLALSRYTHPSHGQVITVYKYRSLARIFGLLAPLFGRISFAVYMLRFVTFRCFKMVILACACSMASICSMYIIYLLARCPPLAKHLDSSEAARCWSEDSTVIKLGYFTGASNTFFNLVLIILPIVVVWRMNLDRRIKYGVGFVIGISLLGVVASMAKTIETRSIQGRHKYAAIMELATWSAVETNIVLITASVPVIWPLFTISRIKAQRALCSKETLPPPPMRCITSWTGYTVDEFANIESGNPNMHFGNCITIEGGMREEPDPSWHKHWYRHTIKPDMGYSMVEVSRGGFDRC